MNIFLMFYLNVFNFALEYETVCRLEDIEDYIDLSSCTEKELSKKLKSEFMINVIENQKEYVPIIENIDNEKGTLICGGSGIKTIKEYINNEFSINIGKNKSKNFFYEGKYFKELPEIAQQKILKSQFKILSFKLNDENIDSLKLMLLNSYQFFIPGEIKPTVKDYKKECIDILNKHIALREYDVSKIEQDFNDDKLLKKINNGTIKFAEALEVFDVLGYEVCLKDRRKTPE